MVLKLLGLLDIASAIIIALFYFGVMPIHILLGASFYLMLKAVIFWGDFGSILDGIMGFLTMINILMHIGWIAYIAFIYLLAKGLISMI